jgi:hypothetical protein
MHCFEETRMHAALSFIFFLYLSLYYVGKSRDMLNVCISLAFASSLFASWDAERGAPSGPQKL